MELSKLHNSLSQDYTHLNNQTTLLHELSHLFFPTSDGPGLGSVSLLETSWFCCDAGSTAGELLTEDCSLEIEASLFWDTVLDTGLIEVDLKWV